MPSRWFKRKEEPKAPPPAEKPAAPALKGVSIGGLLTEELVVFRPPAQNKEQLIETLVAKLCAVKGLGDPSPFFHKVLEREGGISTTLDTGLRLPHARVDGISDISTILGLLPQGLPDPKQPDLPIRAMFLFFSPTRQEAVRQHLQLLRSVAALFQAPFIDELLKSPDPAAVLQLIRSREA